MRLFLDKLMEGKKEIFDDIYGSRQLHLAVLCTLPEYRRRGAGARQCQWGINWANDNACRAVTLFASPMGQLLYQTLNFTVRGTIIVQVKGEEAKLVIKGMAYDILEAEKGSSENKAIDNAE